MNKRTQLLCAWSGPVFVLLTGVGLLVAGWIPPPSPDDSARDVARMYAEDQNRIRVGALIIMGALGFFAAFISVVTTQLRRVEGRRSPLSYMQLGLGMLGVLLIMFPLIVQEVAAFRPDERSPETLQTLYDLSFIPFIGAWFTVVPQWIVIGVVVLEDRREHPLFPRWAGYANLWVATLSVPSSGVYFMKTGPFAWNGLLSFWLAVVAFFAWFIFMTYLLTRAIEREAEADQEVVDMAREVATLMKQDATEGRSGLPAL